MLRSGFGFLFTLLPFPLRSYLSLNVSFSPSLSLSSSVPFAPAPLSLFRPTVLSKGAAISRRAIYRALISIASSGESYRHTSSILELPALDFCVPSRSSGSPLQSRISRRSPDRPRAGEVLVYSPARISPPSSPVFPSTFKLYLNRHRVIYIIDFRNTPVGGSATTLYSNEITRGVNPVLSVRTNPDDPFALNSHAAEYF